MDDSFAAKRREIFFNNLVLLGLDKVAFEKKYGTAFHKDMFNLPNKKGYEVVTYFLFSKLTTATGKDYNIPWPLLTKEQDRLFQKTFYGHLMNFSQENIVRFPRIVPSLLSTFGGDRFYEVYFAFSCYVLSKQIKKNGNISLLTRPAVAQESFTTAKKQTLQLSIILKVQKFKETENCTYNSHLIWEKISKNFEECLQQLKHSLKTNEELLRNKRKVVSSLYSTAPGENLSQVIERSLECWKPVIKQRKNLEWFFSAEKRFWSYIASEVGENVKRELLNGQDYNICISDDLPEECHIKLEKVGFSSSHKDGKLSVVRFIELFMAYLKYVAELLEKNLSELLKICFVEDTSCIQDDLSFIEDLNKKLGEEVIPERKENIGKLKSRNCFDDPKLHVELSSNHFCFPLPVMSFNPEAVKKRSAHFNTDLQKMFQLLPSKTKFSHQEYNDSALMPERNFTSELSCMFQHISSDDIVPNLQPSTSNEKSSETYCMKNNVTFSNCQPTSSKLNLSALDDMDFAPTTHFKIRGSWLNEESLNSVTLPDVSFDE